MRPTLEFQPNGYGFGYDWTLVLPPTKRHPNGQHFLLGQDAKVCARIIGIDLRDVVYQVQERTGSRDLTVPAVNHYVASLIVRAFGGLRHVRQAQSWELHAGGG